MKKLGVVTICVLAGMTYARGGIQDSQGSSEMPQEINTLLKRVNAWKVVNDSKPVYLKKLSGRHNIFRSLLCVQSDYLRYEHDKQTTYRTLQVSLTNATSVNISLQVQPIKDVYPPILVVRVLQTFGMLSSVSPNGFFELVEYKLSVLYGDSKCLILGNSKLKGRDAAGCSMWTPGDKYKKPPFCCEFIYFLLCREIVPVYNLPQCPTSNANSAHSCL